MQSFSLNQMVLTAAMVMVAGAAQAGDGIHAPWPTDWNNWSDPTLWVSVGNINNAADTNTGNLYGSVDHAYKIGKYEVTAGQYTEFLNAKAKTDTYGLYDYGMAEPAFIGCNIQRTGSEGHYSYSVASDWANRPVDFVSFWDAARFTNWLHNGQGNSDTETGAYTLTSNGMLNNTITKNADAKYWIPTEDEWYKAAYHKNDGVTGNYFIYPTSSDVAPSNVLGTPTDPGNNATFWNEGYTIGEPCTRTEVGSHENSDSPYGTFDQGGNVWEWNDTIIGSSSRGIRGGSSIIDVPGYLDIASSVRFSDILAFERGFIGFRIASVPEPSSLLMTAMIALGGLIWWHRTRKTV